MARIEILAPFLLSWEGGYIDHPLDAGGPTNKGVTLKTWKSVGYDKDGDGDIDVSDLKLITDRDAICRVLKPFFWDKVRGDEIKDQAVANMLADWAYMSGVKTPAIKVQALVNVAQDGKIGPITIDAINHYPGDVLFQELKGRRADFYAAIVRRNANNDAFLRGWLRRLDAMSYSSLRCCNDTLITWPIIPIETL